MGFLNGLRGGQYLGFAPQKVDSIDITQYAPLFQNTKPSVDKTSTKNDIDVEPMNTWEGNVYNHVIGVNNANGLITQGKSDIEKGLFLMQHDNEAGRQLYQQGVNSVTEGNNMLLQYDLLKPLAEQQKLDIEKKIDSLKTEHTALDPNGNPLGYKEGSYLDIENYDKSIKPFIKISEMNDYYDEATYATPSFQLGANGISMANQLNFDFDGAKKETDVMKFLSDRYNDIKTISNQIVEAGNFNQPLSNIQELTNWGVLANVKSSLTTDSNISNIISLQEGFWQTLSVDQQKETIQMVFDDISNYGYGIANKFFKVINSDNKKSLEEQANSIIENNPVYSSYRIQEQKDSKGKVISYTAILTPNLQRKEDESDDDFNARNNENLEKIFSPQNREIISEEYLKTKMLDISNIYTYNKYAEDQEVFLHTLPKDMRGGGGGATEDEIPANELEIALSKFKTKNYTSQSIKFYGGAGNGMYSNISSLNNEVKLNSTTFETPGSTNDMPLVDGQLIYIQGQDGITYPIPAISGMTFNNPTGITEVPLTAKYKDAPVEYIKNYTNKLGKLFDTQFGVKLPIIRDPNEFINSENGLFAIDDPKTFFGASRPMKFFNGITYNDGKITVTDMNTVVNSKFYNETSLNKIPGIKDLILDKNGELTVYDEASYVYFMLLDLANFDASTNAYQDKGQEYKLLRSKWKNNIIKIKDISIINPQLVNEIFDAIIPIASLKYDAKRNDNENIKKSIDKQQISDNQSELYHSISWGSYGDPNTGVSLLVNDEKFANSLYDDNKSDKSYGTPFYQGVATYKLTGSDSQSLSNIPIIVNSSKDLSPGIYTVEELEKLTKIDISSVDGDPLETLNKFIKKLNKDDNVVIPSWNSTADKYTLVFNSSYVPVRQDDITSYRGGVPTNTKKEMVDVENENN
jgi:hypothetical protein